MRNFYCFLFLQINRFSIADFFFSTKKHPVTINFGHIAVHSQFLVLPEQDDDDLLELYDHYKNKKKKRRLFQKYYYIAIFYVVFLNTCDVFKIHCSEKSNTEFKKSFTKETGA